RGAPTVAIRPCRTRFSTHLSVSSTPPTGRGGGTYGSRISSSSTRLTISTMTTSPGPISSTLKESMRRELPQLCETPISTGWRPSFAFLEPRFRHPVVSQAGCTEPSPTTFVVWSDRYILSRIRTVDYRYHPCHGI